MSRPPIRARLTAAFALAMALVLAAAGAFVYERLRADLDETIEEQLASSVASLTGVEGPALGAALAAAAGGDPEDGAAQLIDPGGSLVAGAGGSGEPILTAAEAAAAADGPIEFEREVAGIDGESRVLAGPAAGGDGSVAVARSLEDRDETLSNLVTSFAIGGPVAIVIASLVGYLLATAGLAPIEAMRTRADEVSLRHGDPLLPLPAAHDEVHRLGVTLNQMLERLRDSFERERRFVADASHELRTPIAVIRAELEGALRGAALSAEVREALVAAVEECDNLAALAEDLLVLARAADGELAVTRSPVRPTELLESARERFRDRAEAAGRPIAIEADAAETIEADPILLRQALGNLIDNSLRHGGGELVLRSSQPDPATIEIEVADSGRGFAPGLETTAFERFSRGEHARGFDGAGLGLAIVRAVAEAHGGTAAIGPGPGAVVRLRLPFRSPD